MQGAFHFLLEQEGGIKMKDTKKRILLVTWILLLACSAMYIVEVVIQPGYLIKSLLKIALFGGLPLLYGRVDPSWSVRKLFTLHQKHSLLGSASLGVAVYVFIIGGYFLLANFIDLDLIATQLTDTLHVNKGNFIVVALYISLVNSLLEEFFFRGFAFYTLKRAHARSYAYIVSALTFALYHVAILQNWFDLVVFLLLIIGLFAAGLLFNWLNERHNNIYSSWIVHMSANFAINTIGFIMFGIL